MRRLIHLTWPALALATTAVLALPPARASLPGAGLPSARPRGVASQPDPADARPTTDPEPAPGLAPAPGVRLVPLADAAWAGSSVNVVANARQALFTHGRTQFAAFYDADGVMVLARRPVGAVRWETKPTGHRGRVADAHNAISLVADGAGVLHVSWDHHVDPLNYARGVVPGAIELGPPQPMTGARERHVTYPQFWRLPGGDLLFLYRDGASGRGSLVLNRYDLAARTWTTVQPTLLDGEGVRSPYWDMSVDPRGALHLAWIWRETPDVATNHDICYARSADGGRTWTRSDGAPLALPITAATAEYALRIPQHSNLMNSPAVASDEAGRPYVTTCWSPAPGAPPRFHVLHHDGGSWRVIDGPPRTTTFTLSGGGTKSLPISRGVTLVETRGGARRLHLVYRDADAPADGGVVVASRDWPGDTPWTLRSLAAWPVGAWEPAIDPAAWSGARRLQMLVQRVSQRDGDDRTGAGVGPTPIGVLEWAPGR